jgi:hypothetical protein
MTEPVEKELMQHHPAAFQYLQEQYLEDPTVRAVLTLFSREDCPLSWTASMEYLASELLKRNKELTAQLVEKTLTESPRILLSSDL